MLSAISFQVQKPGYASFYLIQAVVAFQQGSLDRWSLSPLLPGPGYALELP